MIGVNKYFRHSKISEARFRHLVRCFVLDLTATQTAVITGISVRSVNTIFSENAKEDGRSL
jgi:transposase